MSDVKIEVMQVIGVHLPEMTKAFMEKIIGEASEMLLEKTPKECEECGSLPHCKEKAIVLKEAAIKLVQAIDEFHAATDNLADKDKEFKKEGCR